MDTLHVVANGIALRLCPPQLECLKLDVCDPLPMLCHHILEQTTTPSTGTSANNNNNNNNTSNPADAVIQLT